MRTVLKYSFKNTVGQDCTPTEFHWADEPGKYQSICHVTNLIKNYIKKM